MMGLLDHSVRVAVTYPEIYEMQITAVFEAVAQMSKRETKGVAQIMVPQVGSIAELDYQEHIRAHTHTDADKIQDAIQD